MSLSQHIWRYFLMGLVITLAFAALCAVVWALNTITWALIEPTGLVKGWADALTVFECAAVISAVFGYADWVDHGRKS